MDKSLNSCTSVSSTVRWGNKSSQQAVRKLGEVIDVKMAPEEFDVQHASLMRRDKRRKFLIRKQALMPTLDC